jgi:CubicO group peptidase (beta-lactamase class C family)
MYDAPLWKAPGEEYSYSNLNFELLGEIVRRVSGEPLADFAKDRIFEPLGMHDTDYILPDASKHRLIKRAPDTELAALQAAFKIEETPWAGAGVCSTAPDMVIFGQMFLNRGRYGDARILSPAAVGEMTRNQIPGVPGVYWNQFYREVCWGFGWTIPGNKTFAGSLWSPTTFTFGGGGAIHFVRLWVDPVFEIVGAFFAALAQDDEPFGQRADLQKAPPGCRYTEDLFINAVTAAVLDL